MSAMWSTIAGALAGAALGALLGIGRARVCGSRYCQSRLSLTASVLGWTILGAAVGYHFATR